MTAVRPDALRPEHEWLLDRAATGGTYVRLLLPKYMDQMSQWNCPFPAWDQRGLFEALHELEDANLIAFYEAGPDDFESTRLVQPNFNARQILRGYQERRGLYYEMTELGGQAWEQAALPDWSRFHKHLWTAENYIANTTDELIEEPLVVRAASELIVRQALLVTAFFHDYVMVPGSEVYSECGPWSATYWKSLEIGVQVSARVYRGSDACSLRNLMPADAQRRVHDVCEWLSDWYVRADDPSFLRGPDPRWWPT